jgi:hypothetical protein
MTFSEISVAKAPNGQSDLFAVSSAGVFHNLRYFSTIAVLGGGYVWTGWSRIGTRFANYLDMGTNADGRLEIFGTTPSGGVAHAWMTSTTPTVNGAKVPVYPWSDFVDMGTPGVDAVRQVVAGHTSKASGRRVAVFANDYGGKVWRNTSTTLGWSGWKTVALHSGIEGIAVANELEDGPGNGRLVVFGFDDNYSVSTTWQTDKLKDELWSGPGYRGGKVIRLMPHIDVNGRIQIFASGFDTKEIYVDYQTPTGWAY